MKACAWLLPLGIIAAVSAGGVGESSAPNQATPQYLGAGSCSASACHNAGFAHRPTRGEYDFWITRDPHARAYEVLFQERSRSIQKAMNAARPAHQDQRCLGCHVAPEYREAQPPTRALHFKTDGVSCESCHGPASQWINEHHLDAWRTRSVAEKKARGMNDTRSISGRAQVCVVCHVGAPGMEVDHDLIAAGHPRLHFELAAFHAHMPRHWPDAKDRDGVPDFDARLWAAGQVASAHAALTLLAKRDASTAWPEFADFDCASCHHVLTTPSDRQSPIKNRKPGVLLWGPSGFAVESLRQILPDQKPLHDALASLRKKLNAGELRRDVIAKDASDAVRLLRPWLDQPVPTRFDAKDLAQRLLALPKASLDQETQRRLAFIAIAGAPPKSQGDMRVPAYEPDAVRKALTTTGRE